MLGKDRVMVLLFMYLSSLLVDNREMLLSAHPWTLLLEGREMVVSVCTWTPC